MNRLSKLSVVALLVGGISSSAFATGPNDKPGQFFRVVTPIALSFPLHYVTKRNFPRLVSDYPLLAAVGETLVASGLSYLAETSVRKDDDETTERIVGGIFGLTTSLVLTVKF